jgi:hypothetical protein
MAEKKLALVVHLATGGEPLVFALTDEVAEDLEVRLPALLQHGKTESVRTKEDSRVNVNFAHVAVAYVDDLQRRGKVFGMH